MILTPEYLGKNGKLVLHVRKLLSSAAYRHQSGQFICEGSKLLLDAVESGVNIRTVIHTQRASLPPLPDSVLLRLASDELMQTISTQKTPQGVLFVCDIMQQPERIPAGLWLVLDGVQDPGNVGTILRSAEAFGASCVLMMQGCADPYLYKTVRASMGSVFRQPFCTMSSSELLALRASRDIPMIAAHGGAGHTLASLPEGDCAIIVGSEGQGVSSELLEECDFTVRIPMMGRCESLNAAVAASVILWERSGKVGGND